MEWKEHSDLHSAARLSSLCSVWWGVACLCVLQCDECGGVDDGAESEVEGGDEAEEFGLVEVIPEQGVRVEVAVLVGRGSRLLSLAQRRLSCECENGRVGVLILSRGAVRHYSQDDDSALR